MGFALAAAVLWAAYILLTQRVGDEVSGLRGLAVSMPVAGLVATVVAGPFVAGDLTVELVLAGLGLAVLLPVIRSRSSSSRCVGSPPPRSAR